MSDSKDSTLLYIAISAALPLIQDPKQAASKVFIPPAIIAEHNPVRVSPTPAVDIPKLPVELKALG
jgi:hypothetical protein